MSIVSALKAEYSDFDLTLKPHPERGDIVPLKDLAAVKNSIKNILNTRPGERPFAPTFGCDLYNYLFEPDDIITRAAIRRAINDSLLTFEPRFKVNDIDLSTDNNNTYNITISGIIINSQRDVDITLLIKRFS